MARQLIGANDDLDALSITNSQQIDEINQLTNDFKTEKARDKRRLADKERQALNLKRSYEQELERLAAELKNATAKVSADSEQSRDQTKKLVRVLV